jgi:hypothetical protein
MKLRVFIFFQMLFLCIKAQETKQFIRDNAIDCTVLTEANRPLYNKWLKNYKCIMVGEMHGTEEPAAFVLGLAKTFLAFNKKVIVGIEIGESEMGAFVNTKNRNDLKTAPFFTGENADGKNSEAWYSLIENGSKLRNTGFCFFDAWPEPLTGRDSVMARKIYAAYLKDTNVVVITLSGNIHSRTTPYKGEKTMGCYLKNYFNDKVLSVGHIYGPGTMYNNTGKGLMLNKVQSGDDVFGKAVDFPNYFIENKFRDFMSGHSALLYTKTITASLGHKQ